MQKVYLISLASCSLSQLSFWYIVSAGGSDLSVVEESDVFSGEGGVTLQFCLKLQVAFFKKSPMLQESWPLGVP